MSATAETLIRDLSARGVRLSRNGDRLRVEGAITPEDRQALAEAKPAILATLTRGRLRALADGEGIERTHVDALPAADVDTCAELPDETLRAYLRALRDTRLRERGQVPPNETATIRCAHCGPVFAAPEVAVVLPIIAGLPTAAGCHWCHVRARGQSIPRPTAQGTAT